MSTPFQTASRLGAGIAGTNLELTGDYNQRLIYEAIKSRGPTTRPALIDMTGLAKPTVAGIVRRLLDSGLVTETTRAYGGRGQPAVHIEVDPEGCYALGARRTGGDVSLTLINAVGAIYAQATCRDGSDDAVAREVERLVKKVDRSRVIGIGVVSTKRTAPGGVGADEGGTGTAMRTVLPGVPIYRDTPLAAAIAAESLFGVGRNLGTYYYILLGGEPAGGLVLDKSLVRGAHPTLERPLFTDDAATWIRDAVTAEDSVFAGKKAPPKPGEGWLVRASAELLPLLTSIGIMLDPGSVLMGGEVPRRWLEALAERCNDRLQRAGHMPIGVRVMPAAYAREAVAIGAASLAMRARLAPIEESLLKSQYHG